MEMDRETIIAALLHDVLEDTSFTSEQLKERFGEDVVTLVDGVTKLGKLQFKSVEEYQAENLRKMFVVMAKDIRVVLIKLADRRSKYTRRSRTVSEYIRSSASSKTFPSEYSTRRCTTTSSAACAKSCPSAR